MRRLFFLLFMFSTLSTFSQDVSKPLVRFKGFGTGKGFAIDLVMGNSYNGFCVTSYGLGDCMKNDVIEFTFEDFTTYKLTSYLSDCNGKSFFDKSAEVLVHLQKPLKSIKYTNGQTGENYTHYYSGRDKDFFIRVKESIDSLNTK